MSDYLSTRPSRERLGLLYRLSQTFNSSLDVNEILNRLIDEVVAATNAERGMVMLIEKNDELVFRVGRGMDRSVINELDFQFSHSVVLRVRDTGLPILTTDALQDERFQAQKSIVALKLRSILSVPIKLKEKFSGIIYVDSRLKSGIFTKGDLEILTAIASTAAVAIDNATLFQDLQDSKRTLETAYDTTLEGWAKALELRDYTTEGHTRRVIELTVRLARAMGITEECLTHIRRGAMLHDIGKMGIPDAILLKPGPLTTEEFDMMKKHPQFAYDMLFPIEFLRPVIEIPYYHHEKWDGTGYPLGLKGEAIPLAARIFAVADVWDAIGTERPYNQAWSEEKAIAYLKEQTGISFDPMVVEAFLEILTEA